MIGRMCVESRRVYPDDLSVTSETRRQVWPNRGLEPIPTDGLASRRRARRRIGGSRLWHQRRDSGAQTLEREVDRRDLRSIDQKIRLHDWLTDSRAARNYRTFAFTSGPSLYFVPTSPDPFRASRNLQIGAVPSPGHGADCTWSARRRFRTATRVLEEDTWTIRHRFIKARACCDDHQLAAQGDPGDSGGIAQPRSCRATRQCLDARQRFRRLRFEHDEAAIVRRHRLIPKFVPSARALAERRGLMNRYPRRLLGAMDELHGCPVPHRDGVLAAIAAPLACALS
ncbi:hypothetical protein ACVIM9_008343 [Bradyrhizobium sp. USDA 4520]